MASRYEVEKRIDSIEGLSSEFKEYLNEIIYEDNYRKKEEIMEVSDDDLKEIQELGEYWFWKDTPDIREYYDEAFGVIKGRKNNDNKI